MEENWIRKRGYCLKKSLAKDLCWAACIGYAVENVTATYIKGFGWLVEFDCADQWAVDQVEKLLGEAKFASVNWV